MTPLYDDGSEIAPEFLDAWKAEKIAQQRVMRDPKQRAQYAAEKDRFNQKIDDVFEKKNQMSTPTALDEFRFPGESDNDALARKTAFEAAMAKIAPVFKPTAGLDPLAEFRLPGEPDSAAQARKSAFDSAMARGQIRLHTR